MHVRQSLANYTCLSLLLFLLDWWGNKHANLLQLLSVPWQCAVNMLEINYFVRARGKIRVDAFLRAPVFPPRAHLIELLKSRVTDCLEGNQPSSNPTTQPFSYSAHQLELTWKAICKPSQEQKQKGQMKLSEWTERKGTKSTERVPSLTHSCIDWIETPTSVGTVALGGTFSHAQRWVFVPLWSPNACTARDRAPKHQLYSLTCSPQRETWRTITFLVSLPGQLLSWEAEDCCLLSFSLWAMKVSACRNQLELCWWFLRPSHYCCKNTEMWFYPCVSNSSLVLSSKKRKIHGLITSIVNVPYKQRHLHLQTRASRVTLQDILKETRGYLPISTFCYFTHGGIKHF